MTKSIKHIEDIQIKKNLFIIYNFKRNRFFALNEVIHVRILRHKESYRRLKF